ncbi:MAG: hypothetical protein SFT68_03115 [Rickettsiaceae bacterium]|nr:hypothetical protein [Rickettsiaceae bacterium]
MVCSKKLTALLHLSKFQEVLDISSKVSIEFPDNNEIIICKAKALFALSRFEESLRVSQELIHKINSRPPLQNNEYYTIRKAADILSSMSEAMAPKDIFRFWEYGSYA